MADMFSYFNSGTLLSVLQVEPHNSSWHGLSDLGGFAQENGSLTWTAPPDLGVNSTSIGAVFAVFGNSSELYNASVTCCSLGAVWVPAQVYMTELTTGDRKFHSPTTENAIYSARDTSHLASFKAIAFDIAWAEVAIPANETLGLLTSKISNRDIFRVLSGLGVTETYISIKEDLLVQNGFSMEIVDPDNIDTSKWMEYRVIIVRNGYSYSIRGLTRRLAAGVLFTYLLIVTIHMITAIWSGWRCLGLQSLIEIMALAINSTPTKALDNTSAGISRLDTYKHIVKVRADFHRHLEIVFGGDGKGTKLMLESYIDER